TIVPVGNSATVAFRNTNNATQKTLHMLNNYKYLSKTRLARTFLLWKYSFLHLYRLCHTNCRFAPTRLILLLEVSMFYERNEIRPNRLSLKVLIVEPDIKSRQDL